MQMSLGVALLTLSEMISASRAATLKFDNKEKKHIEAIVSDHPKGVEPRPHPRFVPLFRLIIEKGGLGGHEETSINNGSTGLRVPSIFVTYVCRFGILSRHVLPLYLPLSQSPLSQS